MNQDAAPVVDDEPTPLRISNLTLNAFRAFPHEVTIDFKDKNLLVYGENGSGKSSIFHALKNFFSLRSPEVEKFKNVFNVNADDDFCVKIQFNDGTDPVDWKVGNHPGSAQSGSDPRVAETALRKSALDYRALLDTNYIHGDERPNLFGIVVEIILADFPVTVEGGEVKTIGELWREIKRKKSLVHTDSLDPVNAACIAFNDGLRHALTALNPVLNALLEAILGDRISFTSFSFSGVTYSHGRLKRDRILKGTNLFPEVVFNGHIVERPQTFLNEARLSALALAMYLAGRSTCVPEDGTDRLKLLVLDDVLIGLDHDNRMPVLTLIQDHYSDWQIAILTHDKVWFDMARKFFESGNDWEWLEIKADGNDGQATPTMVVHQGDIIGGALGDARAHLGMDVSAAANSARRAFEATLRRFAEKRGLKIRFKANVKSITMDVFLDAIDVWADARTYRAEVKQTTARLRAMQTGVLNPLSHADAPNPSSAEVTRAITEIGSLKTAITDIHYN